MSLLSDYIVTVKVLLPATESDSYWEPETTYTEVVVPGCLWQPVSTSDSNEEGRQLWDNATVRVDFPKEFTNSLAGAYVILPDGRKFKVDGDPYPIPFSPLNWNRNATCRLEMEGESNG